MSVQLTHVIITVKTLLEASYAFVRMDSTWLKMEEHV